MLHSATCELEVRGDLLVQGFCACSVMIVLASCTSLCRANGDRRVERCLYGERAAVFLPTALVASPGQVKIKVGRKVFVYKGL